MSTTDAPSPTLDITTTQVDAQLEEVLQILQFDLRREVTPPRKPVKLTKLTNLNLERVVCMLGRSRDLHDYLSILLSPTYLAARQPYIHPKSLPCYICGTTFKNRLLVSHLFKCDAYGAFVWFYDLLKVDHPKHRNHLEGRPLVLVIHAAVTQVAERPDEWTDRALCAELRNFLCTYPSLESPNTLTYTQLEHPLLVQKAREWARDFTEDWTFRGFGETHRAVWKTGPMGREPKVFFPAIEEAEGDGPKGSAAPVGPSRAKV